MRAERRCRVELCLVVISGVWMRCLVEGGAGRSPSTPFWRVNEKARGQEESAGSTTEVLTEGMEGLRLHLFRPSTLPAGPRRGLQSSPGICERSRGPVPPPVFAPPLLSLWKEDESRWGLHLLRARHDLRCPSGEGGCWASTALPWGSQW